MAYCVYKKSTWRVSTDGVPAPSASKRKFSLPKRNRFLRGRRRNFEPLPAEVHLKNYPLFQRAVAPLALLGSRSNFYSTTECHPTAGQFPFRRDDLRPSRCGIYSTKPMPSAARPSCSMTHDPSNQRLADGKPYGTYAAAMSPIFLTYSTAACTTGFLT